jgi:hypothetical protein
MVRALVSRHLKKVEKIVQESLEGPDEKGLSDALAVTWPPARITAHRSKPVYLTFLGLLLVWLGVVVIDTVRTVQQRMSPVPSTKYGQAGFRLPWWIICAPGGATQPGLWNVTGTLTAALKTFQFEAKRTVVDISILDFDAMGQTGLYIDGMAVAPRFFGTCLAVKDTYGEIVHKFVTSTRCRAQMPLGSLAIPSH